MAVAKKTKVKAIQEALKSNEVLQNVVIGKINQDQTAELEQVIADVLFALAKEDKVGFADLGSFEVRETAARKGRNPQTGAEMEIAAGKKFAFSSSATIKKELKA